MLKLLFLWTAALSLSIISGAAAFGSIAKTKSPELAFSFFPKNGFAAENLASQPVKKMIADSQGQFPNPNEIDPDAIELAKQAYRLEPITPKAIAVLAASSSENNRSKLMEAAQTLSRREQLVTGWMIIDSGAREDIPRILESYDVLLRTSSSAASAVIPVLANALANEDFIEPFADLLKNRPPWASRFWSRVVVSQNALGNAARLRKFLHKSELDSDVYRDPALIAAMVKNRQFAQAQGLFLFLSDEKKDDSLVENAFFEKASLYPPFDWQLFSTGEYGATISDGHLQLSAIRGSGGLMARQLVKLPKTAILKVGAGKTIPSDAKILITLICAENLPMPPQAIKIRFQKNIEALLINNAQSGCSYYWLDISGRASENGDGFDVAVDSISLR